MISRQMKDNVLEICKEDKGVVFSLEEKMEDGKMIIILQGDITNEVSHEFEDELMAAISVCKNLVLDLRNLNYIASMALKSLLSVQQMIDKIDSASMILCNVTKNVYDIFKDAGFHEILEIEKA